jgi:divalent metal cation (Fe/Co/Zn/Cd) transporter
MNNKINWDALGITASLACAIHCALLPLFFTSLPVFGVNVIENSLFEIIMVFFAFVVGTYSLYHGFKKHHHSLVPMIVFSVGFVFLILKLFFVQYENWLLVPAVSGIIFAHFINYRSCRVHNHAHKEDCDH